jgi:hypothetical protein
MYKLVRGSNSVFQLWTEWVFGLAGGPAVEALDRAWGARWRPGSESMFHSRRRRVIKEIRRRVDDGRVRDERQAIDQLERLDSNLTTVRHFFIGPIALLAGPGPTLSAVNLHSRQ